MTFAAVGSSVAITGSFSLTPHGVGDLILAEVINDENNTANATALTSSNVTWTLLDTFDGTTNTMTAAVFEGTVTSTSTATVTITWSGTAPTGDIEGCAQEFSSTAGAWAQDKSGHIDTSGTNTWASLTPSSGAGELYFGFANDTGSASAGSTSGYTYVASADGHGNGMAYNPACTAAAQAPVWGDSHQSFGVMVLMMETGGSVTGPPFRPRHQALRAPVPGPYVLGNPGLIYADIP